MGSAGDEASLPRQTETLLTPFGRLCEDYLVSLRTKEALKVSFAIKINIDVISNTKVNIFYFSMNIKLRKFVHYQDTMFW